MTLFRHSLNGSAPPVTQREMFPPAASTAQTESAPPGPGPLLVTAREAARMLSIGERTLWTLTDRGEIPVVRIGRLVRYHIADLHAWINRAKQAGRPPDGGAP